MPLPQRLGDAVDTASSTNKVMGYCYWGREDNDNMIVCDQDRPEHPGALVKFNLSGHLRAIHTEAIVHYSTFHK